MKASKSSFLKVLTTQMFERGYVPIDVCMPLQTIYAFEKAINPEMRCYIYFRYMVSPRAYDVTLGVESVQLQPDVENALEALSSQAVGLVYKAETSPSTRVLFNADVFTKSTVGEILPAKAEIISSYLNVLFANAVEPIFEKVLNPLGLLRLLLRVDPPFDRSFFSRRAFYIAKLTHVTHSDWASIREAIRNTERFLKNDAYFQNYPGNLIDDAYAYFTDEAVTRDRIKS